FKEYEMHIPDGYLGLETNLPAFGAMAPIWAVALNKIRQKFRKKNLPLLALCAAFSFVIMMFNVPIGESSVHAVGAVFIAILMGPWAACISVSMAIIIQALVFGDGGIIAIGINCFNMAFIMPFSGYFVFKLITGKSGLTSRRGLAGCFLGGFTGLNLAALFTAIEFGIQPLLFKAADGTPLYGYYPLSVSVPVMMLEHSLFAGPIEGILTAAAIAYLVKFAPHLVPSQTESVKEPENKPSFFKTYKPFLIVLAVLVILTPIGLLASGTAWGEWGTEELKEKIGFIPRGFSQFADFWKSLLPDYSVGGTEGNPVAVSLIYIVSAVIGIAVISLLVFLASKLIVKKQQPGEQKKSP
ncbi:MAG: cobalt transporter CbiM, partial [Spirochaetales bacterium]|nr:cobalt transporter CbiM [Spirochaetales bacterium]